MLQLLTRLGKPKLVEAMLERLIAQQDHAQTDNAAMLEALSVLSCERAAERLNAIVEAHGVDALRACARAAQRGTEGNICQEAKPAPSRGSDPCGMSPR